MQESNNSSIINRLRLLSEIDCKIAGASAERKKLEIDIQGQLQAVAKLKKRSEESELAFRERKIVYDREEKHLKEAQARLVERRKALTTLGNYKLQLAAEREIDAASQQLSSQEESLISMLEDLGELEESALKQKEKFEEASSALGEMEDDARGTIESIEKRIAEHSKKREELLPGIDQRTLTRYDQVRERYPLDPVVPFRDNSCGGCFLGLGPQTAVEIAKSSTMVRCRGCGRILFLEQSEEE